jgi:hypothetical protein
MSIPPVVDDAATSGHKERIRLVTAMTDANERM